MTCVRHGSVLALSGGIGGAKLALGLSRVVPGERLIIVANTGDDFQHLGLAISPDVDTLLYTLSGLADPVRGWGRRDETWSFMAALADLGGPSWFQLGDADLAIHVERSRRLQAGETLSAIISDFARRFGIECTVVPMSNDPVRTRVETEAGWLDFQDYFVGQRCAPAIRRVAFAGAEAARPHPTLLGALRDPALRGVILCPSNPYLSMDPILAVPGVRAALAACPAPVVAVSPIIGGEAVKGPTAKLMRELGFSASAAEVARHYHGLVDALVVDPVDTGVQLSGGMQPFFEPILMRTLEDRERLARKVIEIVDDLAWRARRALP